MAPWKLPPCPEWCGGRHPDRETYEGHVSDIFINQAEEDRRQDAVAARSAAVR
jgi:hypothetical protein